MLLPTQLNTINHLLTYFDIEQKSFGINYRESLCFSTSELFFMNCYLKHFPLVLIANMIFRSYFII